MNHDTDQRTEPHDREPLDSAPDPLKGLTPITKRLVTTFADIEMAECPLIEYQHGLFCQIALPRSRPEGREFLREYQGGAVKIQAGDLWNGKKLIPQPVPYGPKARLAMIHM